MFKRAIVRTPGRSITEGTTTAHLGVPDYEYDVIEVNVSEFQKIDGGLSCLSLRF